MFYLSPYNDEQVIAGQGSCGVEIVEQLPEVDSAFIAVGGGGLIGGVGSVLKTHNSDIQIYACQPGASAVMAHSIEAGEILDLENAADASDQKHSARTLMPACTSNLKTCRQRDRSNCAVRPTAY